MKKVVALVLALVMLAPTAFADSDTSGGLEKVLRAVKSKIDIPAELSEFESDVAKYTEQACYNFDWHDQSYEKSIAVSADENGRVMNYYNYSLEVSGKKISGISKSEIIAFAGTFLEKTLPEMYSDPTDVLVFDEETYSAGSSLRYSLTYGRYKNSIPVKDNYVNITVCISEDDTLYVRSMSASIDYDAAFAKKTGEISGYVQKYVETFPIELVYQNEYNYDWKTTGEPRTAPVLIYRIKDNNAGFISIENGEIVEEDKSEGILREESAADSAMGSLEKNESLTEKELAEITSVEGLLSTEEVENKLRKLPYVEFPEELKISSSFLSKDEAGEYVYNLHYRPESDDDYSYFYASVYAEDAKLLSMYYNDNEEYRKTELTEQQKEQAGKKTEAFIKEVATEEFQNVALDKSEVSDSVVNADYYRVINGVKHINDGIEVSYDAVKDYVVSFSLNFTDGEFADPQKAISADEAYENLLKYSPVVKMYVKSGGSYVECAALEAKGVTLDGLTGEVKNAYKDENVIFAYSDISGHWAEEAAVKLAEIQVGFDGDMLNPDTAVTQEEFLRFISSGIYGKYYHNYSQDELYKVLIREKIITEEEKNPSAAVTREESFVYTIRMVSLEKIAKLENIYKIDYADSALLSEWKIGYCALLSGLGVICGDGGYLRPTDNLTRAEAVIMLYRYLLTL